jgi:hypothetical protein
MNVADNCRKGIKKLLFSNDFHEKIPLFQRGISGQFSVFALNKIIRMMSMLLLGKVS